MRFIIYFLALMVVTGMPAKTVSAHKSLVEDPKAWFRDGYAPLWNDRPVEQLEAMLDYYAATVSIRREDGQRLSLTSRDMLDSSLKTWTEEGWVRSELNDLTVDHINASTVVFKARWTDVYAEAPKELTCGWYLADRVDGQWRFTAYADMGCEGQDF